MFFVDGQRQLFDELGVAIVINEPRLIALSADKWKLGNQLADIGFPNIPSSIAENWELAVSELGKPPLLLKPRSGNGSRGIARLYDERDFDYWRANRVITGCCSELLEAPTNLLSVCLGSVTEVHKPNYPKAPTVQRR